MVKNILLVLVLLLSAQSLSIQLDKIKMPKNNVFGYNIQQLISLQLQNENVQDKQKVQEILDFLNELLKNYSNDQDKEDATYKTYQDLYKVRLASENERLAKIVAQLKDQQSEQSDLQIEVREKSQKIQEEQGNLAQNQQDLKDGEDQLQRLTDDFEQCQADFTEVIEACEKAIEILKKIMHNSGNSLVQVKDYYSQKQMNEIKHQVEGNKKASHLVELLAQVSEGANAEKVNQIIDLIEQLIDRLRKETESEEANYQKQVNNLNKLLYDFMNLIDRSQTFIAKTQVRLDAINDRLDHMNIEQTEEFRELSDKLISNLKADNQEQQQLYDSNKQTRADERNIVQQLIDIFGAQ